MSIRGAQSIDTLDHPPCTLALTAAAVILLAGCADLRWHREGASAAALERDLAECRSEARFRAGPDAGTPGAGLPRLVGLDALGRPMMTTPGRLDSDRFLVEHDLTRHCMDRKGYALVPAGPGPVERK